MIGSTRPRRVVLASASPRRREILAGLGVAFDVAPTHIDESVEGDEEPLRYVERIAHAKAIAAPLRPGELVIAADTTVDLAGSILVKPVDAADARRMLHSLSGRTHHVHTGVALRVADYEAGRALVAVATTAVTFRDLSEAEIEAYVASGEPMDKAGAYALQGGAGPMVAAVEGSRTNVIGLPVELLTDMLGRIGLGITDLPHAQRSNA